MSSTERFIISPLEFWLAVALTFFIGTALNSDFMWHQTIRFFFFSEYELIQHHNKLHTAEITTSVLEKIVEQNKTLVRRGELVITARLIIPCFKIFLKVNAP